MKETLLKELPIGTRFYYPNHQERVIYKVLGKPEFNKHAGATTMRCLNEKTKLEENRQCRKNVIIID